MAVTISYDGNVPTVGADSDVWGGEINTALGQVKDDLDDLAALANTNETDIAALEGSVATLQNATPVGAVMAFARSTAPTGWLKCNGAAVSRTTYAALFSAIGTTWGNGDGSTTFNLPDLRGEFVRGWDDSRGVDVGRLFGSTQSADLASHTHAVSPPSAAGEGGQGATATGTLGGGETINTYNTGSTGGSETRPRNLALLYCVKT